MKKFRKSRFYDDSGHIDYLVRSYFYRNDEFHEQTRYYSVIDLLSFDTSVFNSGSHEAEQEFNYSPPWIDDELLDYSLRGLEALKF